jgi:molybdopterin converting factor small subunit
MRIEVSVPSLLRDCTGGETKFSLEAEAETLDGALRSLWKAYPLLRVHLMDETERIRKHVLIFLNSDSIARINPRDTPIRTGDRLQVLQNVSGG